MQEWPAYIDLKTKLDNFNLMCPLLEMMSNKAVEIRHWEDLSQLCNYVFDVESEAFTLANVMQAPLLENRDDIEVWKSCVAFTGNAKLVHFAGHLRGRGQREGHRE